MGFAGRMGFASSTHPMSYELFAGTAIKFHRLG